MQPSKLVDNFKFALSYPKKLVVLLSGGLDSTILLWAACQVKGKDNVIAVTFDYGQRQRVEVDCARKVARELGVRHRVVNLDFFKQMGEGFSANIGDSVPMPTVEDVLGDPQPLTYVPNRNMILLSITASIAEIEGCSSLVSGFHRQDQQGFWDTTPLFVHAMNAVLELNRENRLYVQAPFLDLSKTDELVLFRNMDGDLGLLQLTVSCYAPTVKGDEIVPCLSCPTCGERRAAFNNAYPDLEVV